MMTRKIDFHALASQLFSNGPEQPELDRLHARTVLNGMLEIYPFDSWPIPDPLGWNENPYVQDGWVSEFHSLSWLEPVRRLAAAGDPGALEFWISTIKSWVKANPVHGPVSPHAWTIRTAGNRVLPLLSGLMLADRDDNAWLTEALWEHGKWLSETSHLNGSCQELVGHEGLLVIGLIMAEDDWVSLARQRMAGLIEACYDAEGIHVDGGIEHHRMHYLAWETALRRLDVARLARPAGASILRLASLELAYATKPNGEFGCVGKKEYALPKGLSRELDYVNSEGASGHPPSELTKVYTAGYVFGRSGWGDYERSFRDECFYSLTYGRANQASSDRDRASLTLHSHNQPWLIDRGNLGNKCGSRTGQNVVTVEGSEYNPASVVKLTKHFLSQEVDDFEFRDNGYRGVNIVRRVIYCRGGDFFIVIDRVASKRHVTAYQNWNLDSATKSTQKRSSFALTRGKAQATLQWRGKMPLLRVVDDCDAPGDTGILSTPRSEEVSTTLVAEQSGKRFRFVTIVGSGKIDVNSFNSVDGVTMVHVTSGRTRYEVAFTPKQVASIIARPAAILDSNDGPINPVRVLALTEEAMSANPTIPRINGEFSPEYWAQLKSWVRSHDDITEARLAAVGLLFDHIGSAKPSTRNDHGLRAAIVDLVGLELRTRLQITAQGLGIMREPLINWPGSNRLHSSTYAADIHEALMPDDVSVPVEGVRIFAAEIEGLTLPVLVGKGTGGSDILSIRFHGAVNRTQTVLPVFPGATSERKSGHDFAIFSDPSLDLDRALNISWYLGVPGVNLYEYMAKIVMRLARQTGARRVVLAGSSGGGFAALQVAAFLPESFVLAVNPQTVISSYHRVAVERALSACYRTEDTSDTSTVPRDVLSVVERYKGLSRLPKIVYVQNTGDGHHVSLHYGPFKEIVNASKFRSSRVEFIETQDGPGHVAMPLEEYIKFWKIVARQPVGLIERLRQKLRRSCHK